MSTSRPEAFSDGVIAIIITIMVLELKVPNGVSGMALLRLTPVFLSYLLSFLVVAIMWVNHRHLIHVAKRVEPGLLWTNNLLLFWMSLIPFVTAYLGQNHTAPVPVAAYGAVLTLAAFSFTLLRRVVNRHHIHNAELDAHNRRALRKSTISTLVYAASVPAAFVSVYWSFAIFALIPMMYFLPEQQLAEN